MKTRDRAELPMEADGERLRMTNGLLRQRKKAKAVSFALQTPGQRRSLPGRMRGAALLAATLLAVVSVAVSVRADRIRLISGRELVGQVLTTDTQRVYIRTEGGELGIERRRIASIERASPNVTRIEKGYLDLVAGEVLGGLRTWDKALSSGDRTAAKSLSRILVEKGATFRKSLKTLKGEDLRRGTDRLAALAHNEILSPEARFVCVKGLVDLDATTLAAEVLTGPEGSEIHLDATSRAYLIQFWRDEIRRKLAARDYDRALEAINQLNLLDANAGRSQRALWLLSRIGEARDKGDVLGALRLAVEDLLPLLPEVADNRIGLLLKELPDWASDPDAPANRFAEARKFVETTLAKPMPVAAADTLEDLIAEEGHMLLLEGRTTQTLRLIQSTPWLAKRGRIHALALQAEYRNRLSSLPKNNILALYRVGEWAANEGRDDWAIDLFQQCLDDDTVRPLAEAQLRLLHGRIDSAALQKSVKLYKEGRMFDALEALDPILKRKKGEAPSTFLKDASHMADLIRSDLRVESEKRPYQAEVVYQQAERAYFAGDYGAAIQHLAEVLRDYGDTPAAKRADSLLPQVMRTLQLEKMEHPKRSVPEVPPDLRSHAAAEKESRLDQEIHTLLDALNASSTNP